MIPQYKGKKLPIKYWKPYRTKRHLEKLRFQDNHLFNLYDISIRNSDYLLDSVTLNNLVKELKHLSKDKKRKLKVALKERLNECNPNYPLGIQTFTWTLLIGSISSLSVVFALSSNSLFSRMNTLSFLGFMILCFLFLPLLMCLASSATTRRLDAYQQHSNYLQRIYDLLEIYKI